jgi:hypothetical protein
MADPIKKMKDENQNRVYFNEKPYNNKSIYQSIQCTPYSSFLGRIRLGQFNPPVSAPKAAAAGARSRKDMGLSRCCGGWLVGGLRPRRIQSAKTPAGSNPEEKYFSIHVRSRSEQRN